MTLPTPGYWSDVFEKIRTEESMASWRRHMQFIYQGLISSWFPPDSQGLALKTDLFEEAVCEHGLLAELGSKAVGVDFSLNVVRAVRERLVAPVVACDLRKLPFHSCSFNRILSGSSLDHFSRKEEIDHTLRELARVMMAGGVLVITLDNPSNPAVWLRNHLPFPLLKFFGLVPYYVGPTYSAREAAEKLTQAGFRVTHCTAVLHVPRAPAIWMTRLLHRVCGKSITDWFERHMQMWEKLERWPVRYFTGYYVALRVVKPEVE